MTGVQTCALPISVPIAAGYNFVGNPVDAGDNTLAGVVSPSLPPLGTAVYLWNATNQQYAAPAIYSASGWSANLSVPPGTGFVISSTSVWTLTLIGQVLEGNSTNYYPGGARFCLLASVFPFSEALSGSDIRFPGIESQNVFLYNSTNHDFRDACTYFPGYGWYDPAGSSGVAGPVISGGQSFFAQNLGASTNWVQVLGGLGMRQASSSVPKASIQSLKAAGGRVLLSIRNPGGTAYSVQYSADRSLWTTLAANQTGTSWTGLVPGGPQGFYRLANP